MRRSSRNVVLISFSALFSVSLVSKINAQSPFRNWPKESELEIEIGNSETLLRPGHEGSDYGPDEAIAVLGENPLRFLMVCGNSTYLLSGESWASAKPVAKVLSPGPAGSPDSGYAGIGATFLDQPNNRIVGFYHAEDHEGLGKISINGVDGFYGTVCAAAIDLDGGNGRKLGPVITADKPKLLRGWETEGGPPAAWSCQGVGEPHVCVSKDGQHLFCYYTEWSNRLKRGVEICLARSRVGDAGMSGTWEKFHSGKFGEKGIGGHETPVLSAWPVADTFTPHVTYVKSWQRYVMVFGVAVHSEMRAESPGAAESGFYISTSTDGLNWTQPQKALTMLTVFFTGRTCGVHPTLILSEVTGNAASGMLLYGLSENWGQVPHHLAGCPIHLKLVRGRTSGSSNRVTVSGVRNSDKRKASDKPSTIRSRQKTTSELEFEQSLAGNYRLELTNVDTGASDQAMTMELHADKTVTTSDGRSGTWDTAGKRLIVKVPDIKSGPATKRKDGSLVGTLTNEANGLKFRYKLIKVE
jgi:hypothetical protein